MKHMKQTLSGLLAIILLCSACSGTHETSAGAANTSMVIATLMAQQSGASGFTDVEPDAWYAEAAEVFSEKMTR